MGKRKIATGFAILCLPLLLFAGGCQSLGMRNMFCKNPAVTPDSQRTGDMAAGNSRPEFSDVCPPAPNQCPPRRSQALTVRANDNRCTEVKQPSNPCDSGWESADLLLGPQNVVALPGAEVILTVGVRDRVGYLRTNQKINWSISNESVGHFTRVPPRNPRNIFVGDFVVPTIESDTRAVATTGRVEETLDRGTCDTKDDIQIRRGQTWIGVSSAREGITWVTASASMADCKCANKTAKIVWVDAEYKMPDCRCIDFGGKYTLVTTLRKRSNAQPLANWRVRYEILGNSTASFGSGLKVLEVLTDARGQAKQEISQTVARQEDTVVNVQIIRPAEPGTTFTQPVVVQQSQVRYRWVPNTVNVSKSIQEQAYIGDVVPGSICVQNITNDTLRNVRVTDLRVDGLKRVGSIPEGSEAVDGTEWLLDAIAPGETKTIRMNYKVERPGTYTTCARVQVQKLGNELVVESCATLSAGDPSSPYTPQTQEPPATAPLAQPEQPEPSTPPATPQDGVTDPFGSDTPSAPLPVPETPATPPTPSVNDSSPSRAAVLPLEDPNTLLSMDMVASATVPQGTDLPVIFELNNLSSTNLKGSTVLVTNTAGLANASSGDKTRMERTMPDFPPGKRLRLKGLFKTIQPGKQTVTVKVTSQDGKTYERYVTVTVTGDGSAPDATPELPLPTTPESTLPSAVPPPEPATKSEPPLLTLEGPETAKTGESVPFKLRAENRNAEPLEVEIRLTVAPEFQIYGDTKGFHVVDNVATRTVTLAANGSASILFAMTAKTVTPAAKSRIALLHDGKELASKEFSVEIQKGAEETSILSSAGSEEKQPANPVNGENPPTIGSLINEMATQDNPSLVMEITETPATVKVGSPFEYVLTATNTTNKTMNDVALLVALPTDTISIVKDSVQGPVASKVDEANGLVQFDPISKIEPGETATFKVTVKPLKSGVIEALVRATEGGKECGTKNRETRIE
ncbi:MAG: hypothetical protein Q4D98_13390 [Planctomycetia bacterium]|nr:hypothetical protein [Planctomycetia bacterium]